MKETKQNRVLGFILLAVVFFVIFPIVLPGFVILTLETLPVWIVVLVLGGILWAAMMEK